MTQLLLQTSRPFRPTDPDLSSETKSLVQFHRVLTLLGVVLVPAFGLLYAVYNPLSVDPVWARITIAGLFFLLFAASYWVDAIRRNYVSLLRGLFYVLVGWTVLLAAANHFSGDYVAGLLLVYGALIVVIGVGAQSLRPVLSFSVVGLVATAATASVTIAPHTSPSLLLACMATVAFVEGIAIRAYLSTRDQLQEREKRIRGLANSLAGVVFQFSAHPDGSYGTKFVSDQAPMLLGLPADSDNFYQHFLECVPAPHREEVVHSIDRAVEEEITWRFEMPFERPDGTRLWLLATATPERHEEGLVFNGVLLDITERKRAEQTLQDREEKAEVLYTTTDRLVSAADPEEVATRLEEIIWATFDYPLIGVHFASEGRLIREAVSPEVSEQMPDAGALDLEGNSLGAQAYRAGETIVAEDLSTLDNDLDYGALRSGVCVPIGRHGVLSMASTEVQDIGSFDVRLAEILATHSVAILDRIDREAELVQAKEDAEEANQLKTAMLANMSHEFRTPLTAVTGFAEILKDDLDGKPAEFSELIYQTGQRLTNTLDAVLQLSRLECDSYELDRDEVNLNQVLEKTADLHRPQAERKGVDVQLNLPSPPLEGYWSTEGIRRVAEILLDNALKFTPEGGRIELRARENGTAALLEVEDTGIGIREEAIPEVFKAFKQESDGLNREFEGCGLGLSIATKLIDALGGEINVYSEKDEGTCFSVRLPKEDSVLDAQS